MRRSSLRSSFASPAGVWSEREEWWNAAELSRGHRLAPSAAPEALPGGLAKDKARDAALRLAERGCVEWRDIVAARQATPSPHFRLPAGGDGEVLVAFFRAYLADALVSDASRTFLLLKSPYAWRWLTPDLVRFALASRGVSFRADIEGDDLRLAGGWGSTTIVGEALPVRPPGIFVTAFVNAVRESWRKDTGGAMAPSEDALAEHYGHAEDTLLVVPLWALASVSPRALALLLGEWTPFTRGPSLVPRNPIGSVDHVLFQMVFAGVYDLALTRDVAGNAVERWSSAPVTGPCTRCSACTSGTAASRTTTRASGHQC